MAKRKKTPDLLADRESHERSPTPARAKNPSADPTLPATDQAGVASTADPFTALFPPPAVGEPAPSSVRIKLTVTAGEDMAHEVEEHVAQALSAFPYVHLVQAEADWTLIVLGVPIQSPNGKTSGIALSAVVTKTVTQQVRDSVRSASLLAPASAPVEAFRGTWLRIGSRHRIQHLCEQLVADFNDRYLHTERGEG